MAVPKRKVSKARRNKRRSSVWKLAMPGMVECPQCHEMKLSHRVCKNCGFYDGKEVLKDGKVVAKTSKEAEEKKASKATAAKEETAAKEPAATEAESAE